jgi:hypothetical protein
MNNGDVKVPPSDQVKIAGVSVSVSDLLIEFANEHWLAAASASGKQGDTQSERLERIRAHRELESVAGLLDAVQLATQVAEDIFKKERVTLNEQRAIDLLIDQAEGKLSPEGGPLVMGSILFLISQELKRALVARSDFVRPTWRMVYLALSLSEKLLALGAHHQIYERRGTQHATEVRRETARKRIERLTDALRAGKIEPTVTSAWNWLNKQDWQKKKIGRETARQDLREAQSALEREVRHAPKRRKTAL